MSHYDIKGLPSIPMRSDYVDKKVQAKREAKKESEKLSELELYKRYMAERMKKNNVNK